MTHEQLQIEDSAWLPTLYFRSGRIFWLPILIFIWIATELAANEPLGPSSRRTGLVISEIMFHPPNRTDGRNLEFIEIFNSQLWYEDISGYRLKGDIEFTFPKGTILGAGAFLVVGRSPADVQSMHGLTGVLGPYQGSLPNDAGTVQLLHRNGAVLLEITYGDHRAWPPAARGAGHSLVLAEPSWGERDARAWAPSYSIGGSPGAAELTPETSIVINELYSGESAGVEPYIELFNRGVGGVDISGWTLSNDPNRARFTLPNGTQLAPGQFVMFTQSQFGFPILQAAGTLYLKDRSGSRVVDAVDYPVQPAGAAYGRHPNGSRAFHTLTQPTPGASNARVRLGEIVINEIMYAPITGDVNDEYIELFNRGSSAVDLSGWQISGGITLTIPSGVVIPSGGHLVLAKNAANLLSKYPQLTAANTIGDYMGRLSDRGDRIVLSKPEQVISTNAQGARVSQTALVDIDDVTFDTGGRWGKWSNAGGSSLELIDPDSDNQLPSNWADSDESIKSQWTQVEVQGVLDHGQGTPDSLQVLLMGEGECLIDNVEVIGPGGTNRIANPFFDGGITNWVAQGSHDQSSLDATRGYESGPCLHLRSTHRGDTGANRIRTRLTRSLAVNNVATIRAKARWLCGFPEVLFRLRGNHLEAPAVMSLPRELGTPGRRNSRARANTGPAIFEVKHDPAVPGTNQPVTITARVDDPHGFDPPRVFYRIDPSLTYQSAPMSDDGTGGDRNPNDGIFSAVIPGQPGGTMVAFYVEATDRFASPVTSLFPSDAPARECLVRFGDPPPPGAFGTYRLWLTQATIRKWSTRLKLSNDPLDGTFICGTNRIIYNVGALYSGSPFHSPGYNSPTNALANYSLRFPRDDRLLGVTDFKLTAPGNNPGDDETVQREQTAYWIAAEMGLPFNYQRNFNFFINGVRRGRIFEDSQIANSEVLDQWFPGDDEGDLFKIAGWFEFDDGATTFTTVWATLEPFLTTGGRKKLARYRWNWQRRGAELSTSDYSNLFALVDAVNSPAANYTAAVESLIDVDQWMRIFAVEHIVGNWDSYGNNNGQNMFAYKPARGPWKLMMWDLDIVLGGGSDGPTTSLFKASDRTMTRMNSHPPFRRAYWRALRDAVYGPLQGPAITNLLDAKFAAYRANGVTASSPASIKSYLSQRRNYILQQLRTVNSEFAITTANGADFSAGESSILLAGKAPIDVVTIEVNGVQYPLTWTTVTNWTLQIPLRTGLNTLKIDSRDEKGALLLPYTSTVNVLAESSGAVPNHVVINEWMASNSRTLLNPEDGQWSDWFELYNPTSNSIDLSGYKLLEDPANPDPFVIPQGTVIGPRSYLLVWADGNAQLNAPGRDLHTDFRLTRTGDRILLLNPQGRLVDQVAFGGQETDVSEGRWPDGQAPPFFKMSQPTPRAPNVYQPTAAQAPSGLAAQSTADGVLITWDAEPNRRYHLQYKNDLDDPAWQNLTGDIIANGPKASKLDRTSTQTPHRFYRLQIVP